MQWLARRRKRAEAPAESLAVQPPAITENGNVEELSVLLRDARGKARAARQRGRVLQRDGRMSEALRAFKTAGEHQAEADRLETRRALIRRAG